MNDRFWQGQFKGMTYNRVPFDFPVEDYNFSLKDLIKILSKESYQRYLGLKEIALEHIDNHRHSSHVCGGLRVIQGSLVHWWIARYRHEIPFVFIYPVKFNRTFKAIFKTSELRLAINFDSAPIVPHVRNNKSFRSNGKIFMSDPVSNSRLSPKSILVKAR